MLIFWIHVDFGWSAPDYIDEKPKEEKCLLDHQLKDLCYSQFYFLYYSGLVHFISIFATPITFDVAFWITHFGIFLMYFKHYLDINLRQLQPWSLPTHVTAVLRWEPLQSPFQSSYCNWRKKLMRSQQNPRLFRTYSENKTRIFWWLL